MKSLFLNLMFVSAGLLSSGVLNQASAAGGYCSNDLDCPMLEHCDGICRPGRPPGFLNLISAKAPRVSTQNQTPVKPDTNYSKLKALYEQSRGTPRLSDFDGYGAADPQPWHCLGYQSDGSGPYITTALVATKVVAPGKPEQGPLLPADPAKTETKILADGPVTGIEQVLANPIEWTGFSNTTTATDLVLRYAGPTIGLPTQLSADFKIRQKLEYDFRKNGSYLTYKMSDQIASGSLQKIDHIYGYCYKQASELWVANADARITTEKGFLAVGGNAMEQPTESEAVQTALKYCESEVHSIDAPFSF